MAKKDISKILTTGTPKQRILLLAEDVARGKYFMEKLLSDHEFNQLSKSFSKPHEITLYNKFRKADETIANAITNLQGLLFEVKMHHSNLRGYILTWNAIENAELLVNSVLHEIKNTEERMRIANEGSKGVNLLFSETETDQEGYIDIKIDYEEDSYTDENGNDIGLSKKPRKVKKYSLWHVMNNVRKEVINSTIKYLSWESAIADYMDENGFTVKTYKDKIKEMTAQVFTPIIGWKKYYGEFDEELALTRLEKVLKNYNICSTKEELQVDEKHYNWFKKYILGDE